jgi:hypothetical protein
MKSSESLLLSLVYSVCNDYKYCYASDSQSSGQTLDGKNCSRGGGRGVYVEEGNGKKTGSGMTEIQQKTGEGSKENWEVHYYSTLVNYIKYRILCVVLRFVEQMSLFFTSINVVSFQCI